MDKLPNQKYFKEDNSFKYFHKEKLKKTGDKYIGVKDANVKVNPEKNVSFANPRGGVKPDIKVNLTIEEIQLKSDTIRDGD